MQISQIDEGVYIAGQISVKDMDALAKLGIKSLICNRPDHEDIDQPDFEQISQAAASLGIKSYYVPIDPRNFSMDDIVAMQDALQASQRPLLAYCRSGQRSMHVYALAMGKK